MSIIRYPDVEWTLPLAGWADNYALSIVDALRLLDEKIKLNIQGSYFSSLTSIGTKTKRINNQKNFEKLLAAYINLNANLRIDFSTPFTLLKIENDITNYLLVLGEDYQADFIISNNDAYDLIKREHKKLHCIASELIAVKKFQNPNNTENYDIEKEIDLYNELCEKYDAVILRPEFSKNYLLDNLDKFKNISKLEIIVNNPCLENCPQILDHLIAKQQFYENREKMYGNQYCYMEETEMPLKERLKNNNIHNIELIDKLVAAGIKRINLCGGTNDMLANSNISSMLNYMIKDFDTTQMLFSQIEKSSFEIPRVEY
ncbi:MAG: hypothetical protein MJ229_01870 [bacterium]|nr:hypothetical protein [bacterium]